MYKRNYLLGLYLFILMILMREGDTPEGASPKCLGWPLYREKKKNLSEMIAYFAHIENKE